MDKIDVGYELEKTVMGGRVQSALSGQSPMCRSKMATLVALACGAEVGEEDWGWITPDLMRANEKQAVDAAGGTSAYYRQQYECKL